MFHHVLFFLTLLYQDWFTEGMDDTAAILSKFAMIQVSGIFKVYAGTLEGSALPKRFLTLKFSRTDTSEDGTTVMAENEIQEFVQYLDFMNHESDDLMQGPAT